MDRIELLSVPYITIMKSVQCVGSNQWRVLAAHPELPGCVVEADTPEEAMQALEVNRQRYILERVDRDEPVPVPRPPLRDRQEWISARVARGDLEL